MKCLICKLPMIIEYPSQRTYCSEHGDVDTQKKSLTNPDLYTLHLVQDIGGDSVVVLQTPFLADANGMDDGNVVLNVFSWDGSDEGNGDEVAILLDKDSLRRLIVLLRLAERRLK